jgi:cell division inhibitor SepF
MNLFERLRDAFGLIEDDEYYDEYEDDDEELDASSSAQPSAGRRLSNNVIGLPGLQMEVVLMQPRSFEEAPQAVTALRERKSVVLNLTMMEPEQAQRCADYVAGGVFAIDGHQRQLGPNIFLFTPNFVHITPHPATEAASVQQNPWVLPLSATARTSPSSPERR